MWLKKAVIHVHSKTCIPKKSNWGQRDKLWYANRLIVCLIDVNYVKWSTNSWEPRLCNEMNSWWVGDASLLHSRSFWWKKWICVAVWLMQPIDSVTQDNLGQRVRTKMKEMTQWISKTLEVKIVNAMRSKNIRKLMVRKLNVDWTRMQRRKRKERKREKEQKKKWWRRK